MRIRVRVHISTQKQWLQPPSSAETPIERFVSSQFGKKTSIVYAKKKRENRSTMEKKVEGEREGENIFESVVVVVVRYTTHCQLDHALLMNYVAEIQ